MLNDVIKHYTLIFCSYILFTIDDVTSCMYCGVHVGAPGLFLKPVWQRREPMLTSGGEDGLSSIHQEERHLSSSPTRWCPVAPLLALLLQAIVSACLETLKDFCIGSFDLTIALWMSNRCITYLNAKILVVCLECSIGELGPIISDDSV
jgi:hypothetical protein